MNTDRPPVSFTDRASQAGATQLTAAARLRLLESYRPWRKLRYIAAELGVDATSAWTFTKQLRATQWRSIGITRAEGGEFGIVLTPHLFEPLYIIDRSLSRGEGFVAEGARASRTLRERWNAIIRESDAAPTRIGAQTLMEEAAESSIMEGAATTRREAVEMLRTGRTPANRGERMVLNNYRAMQQVKDWLARPLSVEMMLELQDLVTEGTLDVADAGGRLRRVNETVRVVDSRDDSTIFVPPSADILPAMLGQIVAFANTLHEGDEFLHPLVKASILHFLIGYAHPFVDGNGRTARALFYWSALRSGYEIFEYLTISEVIRKGFSKYPQAYLDTELDDGDLTYFVLYKLEVIQQSINVLLSHLKKEHERLQRSQSLLTLGLTLNVRQRLVMDHALRHPESLYSVKSHAASNGVAINTARSDLEHLVAQGLMTTLKRGKEVLYSILPEVADRLRGSRG